MLNLVAAAGPTTELRVLPARQAIVSWNGRAPSDTLELTVQRVDGARSHALPYVAFEPGRRASLGGFDAIARIETDVVHAGAPIAAIAVSSLHALDFVAVSTPAHAPARDGALPRTELDVPLRSQYLAARASERGWCAPAAIAMLLAAWRIERAVDAVADAVFDRANGGTGNWAFCVAYVGAAGLLGAAAYLRDLAMAGAFVRAGIPLALSTAWDAGELPSAPLAASAGHLVVLRGFDARGDAIVNDPAQPAVRHVYPRAAFERCWLDHGGAALLVAPHERIETLLQCANA